MMEEYLLVDEQGRVTDSTPSNKISLFNYDDHNQVTLHSGAKVPFIIDCKALTTYDWDSIAQVVAASLSFKQVIGIPNGGLAFAKALEVYSVPNGEVDLLIADDVYTTGKSMEEARSQYPNRRIQGVVLFARQWTPFWVTPIFVADCKLIGQMHQPPIEPKKLVKEWPKCLSDFCSAAHVPNSPYCEDHQAEWELG